MPVHNGRPSLREWKATHIDEHIPALEGVHEDELFHNCTIDRVAGATIKNCCMAESTLNLQSLDDAMGVTVTLDCHHFANVEFSELAFDYFMFLLIRTKGNIAKRKQLIKILGEQRFLEMLHLARHKG